MPRKKKSEKTTRSRKSTKTTSKKKTTRKKKVSESDLYAMIENRAYHLFEQRGADHGSDWQDWLQAENEMRKQYSLKK